MKRIFSLVACKSETRQKDFFNNKIKPQYKKFVISSIVLFSGIMLICGTGFMHVALFCDKVEPESRRRILWAFSMVCYGACFINPIFTIYFIRKFPMYKKMSRFLLKNLCLLILRMKKSGKKNKGEKDRECKKTRFLHSPAI